MAGPCGVRGWEWVAFTRKRHVQGESKVAAPSRSRPAPSLELPPALAATLGAKDAIHRPACWAPPAAAWQRAHKTKRDIRRATAYNNHKNPCSTHAAVNTPLAPPPMLCCPGVHPRNQPLPPSLPPQLTPTAPHAPTGTTRYPYTSVRSDLTMYRHTRTFLVSPAAPPAPAASSVSRRPCSRSRMPGR